MNEMIYVVCDSPAAFFNEVGDTFVITNGNVGKPVAAPAWIRGTIMYGYLIESGLIRVVSKPEETVIPEKPRKKPGRKK